MQSVQCSLRVDLSQSSAQTTPLVIERKDEIRDLGIITFGAHIETITASARQMIGYIKRVSNGEFTMDTKRILYLAYVRPKLEFGSVIWNPHQNMYIDEKPGGSDLDK